MPRIKTAAAQAPLVDAPATVSKLKPATHPVAVREQVLHAEKLAKAIGSKLKIDIITGRRKPCPDATYLTTGFQSIDDALSGEHDDDHEIIPGSGKGLPRGRIVEFYGFEASSKTSLSLAVIAEAQRRGESAAFIDVEHALDERYAIKAFGVDMETLLWAQPDNGEDALDLLVECVERKVNVIVVDSVAALVSRAEAEGGRALGEQARLMSAVCRKLTAKLKPGGPCVIFLNQVRYKIGVMFGNPEVTSGGNALKFYSSIRAEVRKKKDLLKPGKVKRQPKIVGVRIQMTVKKNKIAPMGGRAIFDVKFLKGIHIPKVRADTGGYEGDDENA